MHGVCVNSLTPAQDADLDHVVSVVGVEHFDQHQVEVQGFQSHPGEAAQQAVMHDGRNENAHPGHVQVGTPLTQHEGGVEQEQCPRQRHVDGGGGI